jgi:hypothetical protein
MRKNNRQRTLNMLRVVTSTPDEERSLADGDWAEGGTSG